MYKLKFNRIFFTGIPKIIYMKHECILRHLLKTGLQTSQKKTCILLGDVMWEGCLLLTLIFGCDKESCTTCTHSKATYTETYWTHEYVTSRDYPKCKQVECWITVVKWIWRWRSGIWPVFTIHPNVSSNKPSKQKQIQDTIYKLSGHGLIFINVSIVFVSSCSLAKHYNGF